MPWPTARGDRNDIEARFGPTVANLVHRALVTGDPLADATIEEVHALGGSARRSLHRGITEGLAALDDAPPAVAAFLAHVEKQPVYVDDALLDTGSLAHYGPPSPAHIVSLSAGALVRVYRSPSITGVLTTTGRLVDAASRRLMETGKWQDEVLLPGAMRRGNAGHVATCRVRLLHAHARRVARQHGYDEDAFGAPVNQVDLARTWLDFTYTAYRCEELLGWGHTDDDLASLYRYWRYIGHVLGLDPELTDGIGTQAEAARLDQLVEAVTGTVDDSSAALTDATLSSVANLLRDNLRVPRALARTALCSLARTFHGSETADTLRLPRTPVMDRLLGIAVAWNRRRWHRLRANPDGLGAARRRNLAATKELMSGLEGATAYDAVAINRSP